MGSSRQFGLTVMQLLAGVGAAQVGDFESIATTTLSTAAASVTFSSIPANYKHLQIRMLARTSNTTGINWTGLIRFNGDTASNYTYHGLRGDGSSAISYAGVSQTTSLAVVTGDDANSLLGWGVGVTDILDYANTNKYKTIRTLTGFEENGSGMVELTSGVWMSSSAITSINIRVDTGTFNVGSQFALYGIKG